MPLRHPRYQPYLFGLRPRQHLIARAAAVCFDCTQEVQRYIADHGPLTATDLFRAFSQYSPEYLGHVLESLLQHGLIVKQEVDHQPGYA